MKMKKFINDPESLTDELLEGMGYIAGGVAAPYTGNFWAFGAVEMFYCLFGVVWGWLTIVLRGAWNNKCECAESK